MLPSVSSRRRPPSDLIAAPLSAFESETQAVIQAASPAHQSLILYVLAAMMAVTVLAMCVVPIERVVQGRGRILSATGSLFVRPLDRAIVTRILVKPGDVVHKGQPLAQLDPTFASADLTDLQQKRAAAQALVDRLSAEQAGRPYRPVAGDSASALQASIYAQRQTEYRQSLDDIDARIRADQAEIARADADAQSYRQRAALAADLEAGQKTLQQKGFGSHSRLVAVMEDRVEAERMTSEAANGAAKARADMSSLQAQKTVFIHKWRDDLEGDLVKARNDLADLTQNTQKAVKVSELSVLTAPADAVVVSVGKASTGSVVDTASTAAEPLFTLTPLNGRLEAEIDVDSKDVGFIRPGDKVRVKLDAYTFTSHGAATGVIETISDDAFTALDNGQPRNAFYKVRVALTDVHLRAVPKGAHLIPGMTLEGDVLVGHRTMMSYILEGALHTGSEAMREP